MTRNKDFKAVVRARMRHTGENYTAARTALAAIPSPRVPTQAARTAVARSRMDAARQQRLIVQRWFVDGRLRAIPSRRKIRAAVLLEVLSRVHPGQLYTEQQISRLLGEIHPDFATVRRELVGLGYLQRRDGRYWVCSEPPVRDDHQRDELPAWEEIWLPRFVAGDRGVRASAEVGR
ncbi:DUF2087 domain-containing protein [Microlunatus soli]|uniref:DUF2087 domain-containing protein n=1 Tax=Microlunatus soli TaxID=630515 RepID=A0A1H1P429_9ACTN|nr:DUF2087 domain-containing protein [Microlunatus soli]SDS05923.1 hypothetical protein SAMN04489812_0754 [Microlunatus soli]